MTAQHVFSVEKNADKRKFLMSAHSPPGERVQFHVYSDVSCFADGTAYCHACERKHAVNHTVDILIAGTSCKSLSKENSRRGEFVECYSDGTGCSGETYQLGFKEAIKKTSPTVALFENTMGVAEYPRDPKDKKKKLPRAVDIVASDMSELGYIFEFQKVDSQRYLVLKGRNRVWGSVNLRPCDTSDSEHYHVSMKQTMDAFASDDHFDSAQCFEEGLPTDIPTFKNFQANLASALQKSQLIGKDPSNIFLDCSTSSSRAEKRPEMAYGVSTCVRPTHKVFMHKHGRCMTPKEHWICQGLFEDDFASPDAVKEVLNQSTLARDLAGKYTYIYIYVISVFIECYMYIFLYWYYFVHFYI